MPGVIPNPPDYNFNAENFGKDLQNNYEEIADQVFGGTNVQGNKNLFKDKVEKKGTDRDVPTFKGPGGAKFPVLAAPLPGTQPPTPAQINTLVQNWLQSTPLTMFVVCFLKMSSEQSKQQLLEGLAEAITLNAMGKLTQDQADAIKRSYEKEAEMNIAAAVAGGLTLAGSVGSLGVGAYMKSTIGGKTASKMETITYTTTAIQQGSSALGNIGEKGFDASANISKGEIDAIKTMVENHLKLIEQRQQSAAQHAKGFDDFIAQLLQTLSKMVSENIKAHSMQIR